MSELSNKSDFEQKLFDFYQKDEHIQNQFNTPFEFISLFSNPGDLSIPELPVSPDNADLDENTLVKVQTFYKEAFRLCR